MISMSSCCRPLLLRSLEAKRHLYQNKRSQPLKVAETSTDLFFSFLFYKLHTFFLSCTRSTLKMEKKVLDGSVQQDYCTHHAQISHLPPIHFPSRLPCSNGWHRAFVKVKVERPTPDDTTHQFFHFFRSASLLLLSVHFWHLEKTAKCKTSTQHLRNLID